MKKRKLALGIIGIIALTITGCSFKFVNRSALSSKQDVSSYETHESSLDNESSSGDDLSSVSSSYSSSIEQSSSSDKSSSQTSSSSQASSSSENKTSSVASSSSSSQSSSQSSSSSEASSSSKSSSSQASISSSASSSSVASSSSATSSSQSSSSSAASSSQSSSSSAASSSSSSSSSSQANQHVTLDIFSMNDTHGNVLDTQGKGLGLAKTTTALKELSSGKNSIFISQGDMWQGSVESNYTRGKLVTEWMNSMNFVSMAVGNHEFDWGQQEIANNQDLSTFPILGINVLYRANGTRVEYLEPSTTFARGGAKIGVIGAIGNCLSSISSSNVSDIFFAKDDELSELIKEESTRLRNEEHCDFIIYSLHGSASTDEQENYDLTLSSGHYVDLVLEGHSHQGYAYTDEAGIYHVQGKAYNQEIYQITVDLDLTHQSFNVEEVTPLNFSNSYSPYRDYSEDSGVLALLDKYHDQYSVAYEELGVLNEFKNATTLKSKVADLYYEKGYEKWHNNYDLVLGGGYISCRSSGIGPGMVTYGDVAESFPFDNEIVLCSIRGYQLTDSQFVDGSNYNYYVTWSDESIKYNLESYTTYYLVTDTFTSDYYRTKLTIVDYLEPGKFARDLIAEYIREGNWSDVPIVNNHEGTISDPKTIEEAREQAVNYTTASDSPAYYFKGVVCTLASYLGSSSNDMCRLYVKDADKENATMIYYLRKFYGANKDNGNWESVDDLSLGDELVFYGRPYLYGTTIEFASGTYVYSINGVLTQP